MRLKFQRYGRALIVISIFRAVELAVFIENRETNIRYRRVVILMTREMQSGADAFSAKCLTGPSISRNYARASSFIANEAMLHPPARA
jgi:hypothetical protein